MKVRASILALRDDPDLVVFDWQAVEMLQFGREQFDVVAVVSVDTEKFPLNPDTQSAQVALAGQVKGIKILSKFPPD